MTQKPEHSRDLASIPSQTSPGWRVIVLMKLRDGPKRLSRLRREVGGIPQYELTQTLSKLEQEGAVLEKRVLSIPPSVKYELTDVGHDLLMEACVRLRPGKSLPRRRSSRKIE